MRSVRRSLIATPQTASNRRNLSVDSARIPFEAQEDKEELRLANLQIWSDDSDRFARLPV